MVSTRVLLSPDRAAIPRCRLRAIIPHAQLGLLHTSCSGNTYKAAVRIKKQLGTACSEPISLEAWAPVYEQLQHFSGFIVGAPTYNTNARSQRTGTTWDDLLYNGSLQHLQLQGKPFAVFGCGDAMRFPNNFADAIAELHDVFCAAGGIPLSSSYTCSSSYLMKGSKAIITAPDLPSKHSFRGNSGSSSIGGGSSSGSYFVGLPLDYHNQPALADSRISDWCGRLLAQLQLVYPDALLPNVENQNVNHQNQYMVYLHLSTDIPAQLKQQQQQPLEIGDWAAAWPSQGDFHAEYPRGFRFTDRWYCMGDRWYRFADLGFQVRAGFREHVVYTYAYKDIVAVEVRPQIQTQQQQQQQQLVDVWVTSRGSLDSSSSSSSNIVLVLRDVECWEGDDGSSNTIVEFLRHQMQKYGNLKQLASSHAW